MGEDKKPSLVECYKRRIKAIMENESIDSMLLLENLLEQALNDIIRYRAELVDALRNEPDYDYEKAYLAISTLWTIKDWTPKEKEND